MTYTEKQTDGCQDCKWITEHSTKEQCANGHTLQMTSIHQALAEDRERGEIEEIPQFEGTLEALNKLTIIK